MNLKRPDARPPLSVRPLSDLFPDDIAIAFTAGFAGYLVPINLTAAQLDARFRSENGDPFASYVFYSADDPVAILLINRRGRISRVGAMGVAPEMRGTGLGAEVIRRAVSEARARGDTRLVLEVIQSNVPAVKLYEKAGFRIVRSLWGFSLDLGRPESEAIAPLIEIDSSEGAIRAGSFGATDLPWQIQIPCLAAMLRPTRCFTNADRSIVVMVDASQETIRLKGLAIDANLSATQAAEFTRSLRAAFPDRPLNAPPLFTDAHRAKFFEPGAWTPMELRQFEMSCALDAVGHT